MSVHYRAQWLALAWTMLPLTTQAGGQEMAWQAGQDLIGKPAPITCASPRSTW